MTRGLAVLWLVFAASCGRTPIYGDDGEQGDDGPAEGDPAGDDDQVDWMRSFGVILVEFRRAPNVTGDPLAGTQRVVVELDYLACILDFYATNPSWRRDGADGAEIFDAAAGPDGLCGIGNTNGLECDVVEIEERVDDGGERVTLRVVYDVRGVTEGSQVSFGPLPTAETAQCTPIVRVARSEAVQGFDASGGLLWKIISFSPDKAQTNQGLPFEIRAGPP